MAISRLTMSIVGTVLFYTQTLCCEYPYVYMGNGGLEIKASPNIELKITHF